MAKTSSMPFFDPELANAPALSKWQAEFNRAVADLGKFWSNGKATNIDVSWLLSHQHKIIEAPTAASEAPSRAPGSSPSGKPSPRGG